MFQVNLSRVHSMIKETRNIINSERNEVNKLNLSSFYFKIFEKTKNEDLKGVMKTMKEDVKDFEKRIESIRMRIEYVGALKGILEKANAENGINSLLSTISFMREELDLYNRVLNFVSSKTKEINENMVEDVEFYKSAFTADNKTYSLELRYFDKKDVEYIRSKVKEYETTLASMNNILATKNQSILVDVYDFDEFIKLHENNQQAPGK